MIRPASESARPTSPSQIALDSTTPRRSIGPVTPNRTTTYRLVAALCRPALRLLFRPHAGRLEFIPADGGYVLAANQLSNLDGFALAYCLFPRQLRWMGKAELFHPLIAQFLRAAGIFPVRRGAGDLDAIAAAVGFAREGHAVGIFPEGTRRRKGLRKKHSARPHTGAARVALAAGVPLVPAAIAGTERLTQLRRWRVAFGPPIPVDGLDGNPRLAAREMTRRLMDAIAALEAELQSQTQHIPRRLYPRLLIDITIADLMFALRACLFSRRAGLEDRVLRTWSGGQQGLVCLSVRSGLDLLLQSLELSSGDEVIVSAVTHPDMVRVIETHGLRVLPADIDPDSLAPRLDILERAITPRTRLIVVAHLFGGRVDLAPVAELARHHDLLLVEDCAQAFRGPDDAGDTLADVSLFSFGSIKTSTALGGCLVRVDDATLRARMLALHEAWSAQSRSRYTRRVVKFVGLVLLGRPRVYSLFARVLAIAGKELDEVVNGAVRGFPGADLVPRIRRRPSAPLLALLERRLKAFDSERVHQRTAIGEYVAAALPPTVVHPGRTARDRTHWVFPVITRNRALVLGSLLQAGFDAATKTSGIGAVEAPVDRPELEPESANRLMEQVVFMPVYPEMRRDVEQLLCGLIASQPHES
jgi:perosamine synthetase